MDSFWDSLYVKKDCLKIQRNELRGKLRFRLSTSVHDASVALKDKYPNFEVGLKCIIMVF